MKVNQTGESSPFAETFTGVWRNRDSKVGIVLLALIVLSCAAASMIVPYGVNEMDLAGMPETPSLKHIFGADAIGRDLFSHPLYREKYSLALGVYAAVFSTVPGCLVGCIARHLGGRAETLTTRFLGIWFSLPSMLLCILISVALGTGFFHAVLTLVIGNVPIDIRLIRGQILLECSKDYLEATQFISCSHLSIMFRYILPNVVSPVIVGATTNIDTNITMAAALPYVNLGVQPPTPGWGTVLADAKTHILNYPHLIVFPGTVIAPTVLAINLAGDGLRDIMDPKLRSWKECLREWMKLYRDLFQYGTWK